MTLPPLRGIPWRLAIPLVLGACAPERPDPQPAGPRPVDIVATGAGFDAPDRVSSGWLRLRFRQTPDGRGRNLVVFALADSVDVATLVRSLDSASSTPAGAVPLGGSESPPPEATSELILRLDAGRHLLASLTRDSSGRRYVGRGGWRELRVEAASSPAPGPAPTPTMVLPLADFAFPGPDRWPAGRHLFRVANLGREEHLVIIERLEGSHTLAEVLRDPDAVPMTPVAGVGRLGPGKEVYLPAELPAGRYLLLCLLPHPGTGRSHVELGMVRMITVVDSTAGS